MQSLEYIDSLVRDLFSKQWAEIHPRAAFRDKALSYPGVYLICLSADDMNGAPVRPHHVLYVGVSVSEGGAANRLRRFRTAIEIGKRHSGGRNFRKKWCGGVPYSEANLGQKLYFAALTLPCNADKSTASCDDFRTMGHVHCLEDYAIAHVLQVAGRVPPLNSLGQEDNDKDNEVLEAIEAQSL